MRQSRRPRGLVGSRPTDKGERKQRRMLRMVKQEMAKEKGQTYAPTKKKRKGRVTE